MVDFVHLRIHSRFSIGGSILNISDIPVLCKKNNMKACALTDRNLMSGVAEFSAIMPKNGIKPIIGIDISLNHHTVDTKLLRLESLSKILLLAKNHEGYLNLCKLNRIMYMRKDNLHLGPYVDFSDLEKYKNGLICLSGSYKGPIGKSFLGNQDETAFKLAENLSNLYPNNFYIELQRHGLEEQIKIENKQLDLATKLNLPIVATNAVRFSDMESFEAADALNCVLSQSLVMCPDRQRQNVEHYFKSSQEMIDLFSDLPEAIENTNIIATKCNFLVNVNEKPLLPKFGKDIEHESEILHKNTYDGLKKRLETTKVPEAEHKLYYEQAEFEISTIIKMGFPGYFLIVADYIDWCRKNDILVGPGRGSGAGSVVAWALGITNVNPLKYGLLFERFLNPDRVSMPDFDVDFEPVGIERVLNYVSSKYGADSICRIITFGSLQARGAIRDIARVYNIPYTLSDKLAKLIPMDVKSLKDALKDNKDIDDLLEREPDLKHIVDIAQKLEGSLRNLGQHACGVVIGDRPTTDIAPVYRDPNNPLPSSQFDGHYLEATGLIKFDFLGLETLAILKYALKLIKKEYGKILDLDKIPIDDPKAMELFKNGITEGIFQFDAPHIKQILKKMNPTSFLNIIALNALNRPGPIAFIPTYIARMHGEEKIEYVHPLAEPILKETYGVIVYQEQVMQLTRVLAGFTRGQSDNVRKAMGKKKIDIINELEVKFVEGCLKEKTLSEESARQLWGSFKEFAKYAFNKSHSVAYSVVANQCAYIKAYYPAEFIAASMSSNINDSEQLYVFIEDAKNNFNISIEAPSINKSESLFTVKNNKIIYGLAALKGVGTSITDLIIEERNKNGLFRNITDFAKRCSGIINKRVMESFVKAGVFDTFNRNRGMLFENIELILSYSSKSKDAFQTLSLFSNVVKDDVSDDTLSKQMSKKQNWSFSEMLTAEMSIYGFYMSAHPLDEYKKIILKEKLHTTESILKLDDKEHIEMAVYINSFSKRKTKTGKDMLMASASDSLGNIELISFGENTSDFYKLLSEGNLFYIEGKLSKKDDRISVFLDRILSFDKWLVSNLKKITIEIRDESLLKKTTDILSSLEKGNTKIFLSLFANGKKTKLSLPNYLKLTSITLKELEEANLKVSIE